MNNRTLYRHAHDCVCEISRHTEWRNDEAAQLLRALAAQCRYATLDLPSEPYCSTATEIDDLLARVERKAK